MSSSLVKIFLHLLLECWAESVLKHCISIHKIAWPQCKKTFPPKRVHSIIPSLVDALYFGLPYVLLFICSVACSIVCLWVIRSFLHPFSFIRLFVRWRASASIHSSVGPACPRFVCLFVSKFVFFVVVVALFCLFRYLLSFCFCYLYVFLFSFVSTGAILWDGMHVCFFVSLKFLPAFLK